MTRATRSQVAQAGAGPKVLRQPAQSTVKLQSQTKINISIVFMGPSCHFIYLSGYIPLPKFVTGDEWRWKEAEILRDHCQPKNIKAVRLIQATTLAKLSRNLHLQYS